MVTVTTPWADERLYYLVHAVPYSPAGHVRTTGGYHHHLAAAPVYFHLARPDLPFLLLHDSRSGPHHALVQAGRSSSTAGR